MAVDFAWGSFIVHDMTNPCDSEEWKPVLGYEGYYLASRSGLIMSIHPYRPRKIGTILKPKTSKKSGKEYHYLNLSVGGKVKTTKIHRMVYEAFMGKIPEGLVINHKNGVKTDNRLENLEVMTTGENVLHGYRVLGRKGKAPHHMRGEETGRAKLTNAEAEEIRYICKHRLMTHKRIAELYGISPSTVGGIAYNLTYQGPYVEPA